MSFRQQILNDLLESSFVNASHPTGKIHRLSIPLPSEQELADGEEYIEAGLHPLILR